MLVAVLARLGALALTVCGVVALVLCLLALAPGDPIDLLQADPLLDDDVRARLAAEWHLDRPLLERYGRYLAGLAAGDLGTSLTYRPGVPVRDVIAGPAVRSAGWVTAALALALLWGTALATVTATRRSLVRPVVQLVSITPVFLLAHLSITGLNEAAFALLEAGRIDRPGWFALPDQPSTLRTLLAVVLLAVGSGTLAEVHGSVEEALGRIYRSGYVDAARARGAPVWPHVLRNLVPPLTTIVATRAAFLVGGLVVLEKVLLLNGVGAVLWQAAELRDYDLALGIAVLAGAFVAGVRFLGDTVRIAVDPRPRAS